MAIFNGFLVGISTAILLGPVFFTLVKNSHQHGFRSGLATAIGIIVSDIIIVGICFYAAKDLLESIGHHPATNWVAGAVLAFFGIRFVMSPLDLSHSEKVKTSSQTFKAFTQGFLVNFVNPFVFFVWLTFLSFAEKKYDTSSEFWIHVTGILLGIFITDFTKVLASKYLLSKFNSKTTQNIYKLIGLILVGFAIRFFVLGASSFVK